MIETGLMRLFNEEGTSLKGRRLGWLANATTVDGQLRHAVERSLEEGWRIERLFGPEHGLWGTAQDMIGVGDGRDPITGLPTISLYGHDEESLKPRQEDLDVVSDRGRAQSRGRRRGQLRQYRRADGDFHDAPAQGRGCQPPRYCLPLAVAQSRWL